MSDQEARSAASSSGREVSGEGPMISRPDSPAAQGRRRVQMPLSGGHMDVTLEGDASTETLDALRSVGEAALKRMEESVSDLIGKKATIVGYSETGDGESTDLGFVAHVCLDIEDGPRVFFQATDTKATWRIVEEPRGAEIDKSSAERKNRLIRHHAESVVRAWMTSKVTPSSEIAELQRVLESGHQDEGNDVR